MSLFKAGAGIACLDYPTEKYPAMTFSAICEDKYDECNVRALALENDRLKLLFMVFDLSDIPEVPDLEKKISSVTGFPAEDIIIIVTHNHTSPCDRGTRGADPSLKAAFRRDFLVIEEQAAIAAASDAVRNLRPARYGYGEINSYIADNEITRDPEIGYYCDPENNGYIDNTLSVISFVDYNDKPICFLMNHPCHGTFAMDLDANGKHATSGNFMGITSRFLEEYYEDHPVAIWTPGASGNLHPILHERLVYHYTDGYRMSPALPGGASHVLMEHTGRKHAIDAINCISRITDYSEDIEMCHIKDTLSLSNQKNLDGDDSSRKPRGAFRHPDYGNNVKSNQNKPAPPFIPPVVIDDPAHPSTLNLEIIKIGNVAIAGLGCELFCQIGRDIKSSIPSEHTIVITHTPGYVGDNPHAVGYIVDRSSASSHNAKVYRNLKPGEYDEIIVDKLLTMYNKVK